MGDAASTLVAEGYGWDFAESSVSAAAVPELDNTEEEESRNRTDGRHSQGWCGPSRSFPVAAPVEVDMLSGVVVVGAEVEPT